MITQEDITRRVNALLTQTSEKPDHFVMNVNEAERNNISTFLHKIPFDVRPIYHNQRKADQWSLEACSKTKSLATMGKLPTQ